MEIWVLQEEQEFLFDPLGRDMCMHAVKAGCAREHQCLLLQVVIPKYSILGFFSFCF